MLNFCRVGYFKLFLFFILFIPTKMLIAHEQGEGQLIFISDFIRHGARTPVIYLDAKNIRYPLAWKNLPAGQLTAQGLNGEKNLGSSFRKTYIEDQHFLGQNYDDRKICIRSSGVDRTLMSATAVLLGLYPLDTAKRYTLKIHELPTKQDTLLAPSGSNPAEFLALLQRYVFETPEWKSKFDEIKSKFDRWSQETGYPVSDFASLSSLTDTVSSLWSYCQQANSCMTQSTGLTPDDVAILLKWQNWSSHYIFATQEVGKFIGCNPVSEIITNMNKVAQGYRPFSYILYSAHDINLLGLLSYLGYPLDHQPPFGANLRFSLYKIGRKNFEVQVDYFEQGKTTLNPIYRGSLKDFSRHYYNNACFQAIKSIGQCNLYDKASMRNKYYPSI
jgi:phosphatidylethanolamine-binding protein (PEBP) family uncharacterized protein